MNGLELCNRIKSDINLSHIPVILLTAKTAEKSVIEGLQMGADAYITKPFNRDLLILRIEKFINLNKQAHKEFIQKNDPELNRPGPSIDPRLLCRWLRRWYLPKLRKVRQQGHCPLLFALQILIVDIGGHCYAGVAQEL